MKWKTTEGGLTHGGRNGIVQYTSDDGWFVVPENNWATCITPGKQQGTWREKLLWLNLWNGDPTIRVMTNPKAVQLTLFPHEEVEYFSVNLGVFQGDGWDGRVAVAEHLRKRFKFHDPSRQLSTNDWQWGANGVKRRTDADYRNIVIPTAAKAGFDRIHIDDFWYEPQDGCDPTEKWTDMPSLCNLIVSRDMKPGHWFSLQGRFCYAGWGEGRDCADPANVDFKLKQTEEILIAKYHTAWSQIDAGLLWKTDQATSYSHPADSVYRKLLGMRRYINTITHKYPDYLAQVTCEIDNPAGDWTEGNQNVGLAHLGDNALVGMYLRTDSRDNVRDMFDCIGLFPLEGMATTWGEGGQSNAWQDSPAWYYQFLLARHTSIYSWPGDWSQDSIARMRDFNDWRKNLRIKAVLNEVVRPVFNGRNRLKNEGPWAWMFVNEEKTKALLFALNHLTLSRSNAFSATLRWLDPAKTYLIEDVTMKPSGGFAYGFRGVWSGRKLRSSGFPINLDSTPNHCAAYWIQELRDDGPQVLYASESVFSYSEKSDANRLEVQLLGAQMRSGS